jgi:hypothetical protein
MRWDTETPPAKIAGRKFRMTKTMSFETIKKINNIIKKTEQC